MSQNPFGSIDPPPESGPLDRIAKSFERLVEIVEDAWKTVKPHIPQPPNPLNEPPKQPRLPPGQDK